MNAVGVLITRAAMPADSTDDSSASWLCRFRLIASKAGRAAGGTLARLVRVQDGPMVVVVEVDDLQRRGALRRGFRRRRERARGCNAGAERTEKFTP